MARLRIPHVAGDRLTPLDPSGVELPPIVVGSSAWYEWLHDERNQSFAFATYDGQVTIRRERKRNGWYWYAYRKRGGKLRKAYIGKPDELTVARLGTIAQALAGQPDDSVPTALRLKLLGSPQVLRGEQPVAISMAKALALLAYLASAGAPQRREHILDLLWPGSTADAARKNLRNTLWFLRTALGPEILHAGERLALNPDIAVDVHEFERLIEVAHAQANVERYQAALTLYGGPLLDGLTLADAPEFELWLTGERERLGQAHMRTLHALVESYRAAGRWSEVLVVARRALQHDPLQEAMYRALMEAHARLGQRAEALRQYELLRGLLDQELGVTPLAATEALHAAIIDGTVGQGMTGECAARLSHDREHAKRVERPGTPFVGRAAERAALDEELTAARERFRVVLLTGEVGIGKTRLWQEWAAGLGPDIRVVQADCAEATQAMPFAPLVELFGGKDCHEKCDGPNALPPHWLAELARLAPQLRATVPNLPAPAVLPPEEERRRVFEALVQGLRMLGSRPLVFFVDDVQWADRATLEWLGYLVERMRDQPLLLVVAYRPEDAPAPLVRLISQWGRQGATRRLPLARLVQQESAALVAALGGDQGRIDHLHAESAGNPYFLSELVRAAPGDVPPALADLVRARLDQLPDPARQVIQAAAVLDPDIDFATLREIGGRDEDETLDALDALLQAALLDEQGTRYTFAHPLVAAVVRDGISGARRAVLHRRAAAAREAAHAGQLAPVAGRLATHYREAGDTRRAAHYAEMAAEHALTLAAADEAIAFYRQAIALESAPSRFLGLGRTLFRRGDLQEAQDAFTAAVRGFEALGDRRGAAHASLQLADVSVLIGRCEEVTHWGERARAHLEAEDDPSAQALVHLLFGANPHLNGKSPLVAETHLTSALHLALEHDLFALAARARFAIGNLKAEQGDLADALNSYRESIRLSQAGGDQFQEVLGHNNAAYHALLLGQLIAAHRHIEDGLALAEARGLRMPLQFLYSTRGEIALAEQQWSQAQAWFTRGLAEAQEQNNLPQVANYQANLGLAARGRGDLDEAVMLLEAACDSIARLPSSHLHAKIDLWLAEVYAERGEWAAAEDALNRAETRLAGGDQGRLEAWAARLREQQLIGRKRDHHLLYNQGNRGS